MSGSEDPRRVVAGTVASQLLQQGLAVAAPLVVVPAALAALGSERYGAWLLASSLIAMAGFSLGLPQALVDVAARGRAGGGLDEVAHALRQAFVVLGVVGAGVALLGAAGAPGLAGAVAGQAGLLAAALVLAGLSMPLGVVRGLAEGLQEARGLNLLSSVFLAAAAGGVVAGLRASPSALWLLLLPASAAAAQLVWLAVLRRRHAWLRAPRAFRREGLAALLGGGGWFTVVSVAWLLVYSTDVWVVRLTAGLGPVAGYGLVFAIFNLASEPMAATVQAARPAVVRLSGDDAAVLLRKGVRLGAVAGLAVNGAVLLWHRPLLDLWVGPGLETDFRVALALAGFQAVRAMSTPAAWTLVPLDGPRRLALAIAGDAALNLGASLLLGSLLGPWGVALGSLLGIAACSGWYLPAAAARRLGARLGGRWIAQAALGAAPLWLAAAWMRPTLAGVRAGGDLLAAAAFLATALLVAGLVLLVGLEREERAALAAALRRRR